MALTFTNTVKDVIGSRKQVTGTVTFDNSYVTGGVAFTPANLTLYSIDNMVVQNTAGYQIAWNKSSALPTLIAYQGDNTNAGAAPGIQVPNATNLSTVVATYTAIGRG